MTACVMVLRRALRLTLIDDAAKECFICELLIINISLSYALNYRYSVNATHVHSTHCSRRALSGFVVKELCFKGKACALYVRALNA